MLQTGPFIESEKNIAENTIIVIETNIDGLITHVSNEFSDLTGYSATSLAETEISQLKHPDTPSGVYQKIVETTRRGNIWTGILKHRTLNGETYWSDTCVFPLKNEDNITGFQYILRRPQHNHLLRAKKRYKKSVSDILLNLSFGNRLFVFFSAILSISFCLALIFSKMSPTETLYGLLPGIILSLLFCRYVDNTLTQKNSDSGEPVSHETLHIYTGRTDQLGQLQYSLYLSETKLSITHAMIQTAISEIAYKALETSATAEQTRMGMQQQQQDTEQIASAITQMAASIQSVARNTVAAADAAHSASNETENIKLKMTETIAAICNLEDSINDSSDKMKRLNDGSENIDKVLYVIKSIAEQTNLLALNAAIEAARAGDAGRGFTVVADEVRTLASRTSDSTQEIQSMIENLQSGTRDAVESMQHASGCAENCVEHITDTAESVATITGAVSQINDMNTLNAASAEQQSAVAEDINRNIHLIDETIQQTATTANQTANTSEELLDMIKVIENIQKNH